MCVLVSFASMPVKMTLRFIIDGTLAAFFVINPMLRAWRILSRKRENREGVMRRYHQQIELPSAARTLAALAGEKLQAVGKSFPAFGLLAVVAALLGACASQQMERPTAEMTRAEAAIESAVERGARQAAPMELQSAQSHFSQAQQAVQQEDHAEALRHAEKAEVDAELAEAKARAARADDTLAELKEGIQALEQELNRSIN
jgi:hypothetical protein